MRKQIFTLSWSTLLSCAILWGGQASRLTERIPVAGVTGHITIDEVVGKKLQSDPIPKLKVYLLRVDDSRPLVELQMSCRHAVADPNADPLRAYKTCDQSVRQAVNLVPTLPSVATVETDRDGQYEFTGVPAAGRYRIVGVKTVEGAEPLVIVGITDKLKAGERVTLNLSANDPWTRDAAPQIPTRK
jgi:hypothetical protein